MQKIEVYSMEAVTWADKTGMQVRQSLIKNIAEEEK
jgi:hypothetical protein